MIKDEKSMIRLGDLYEQLASIYLERKTMILRFCISIKPLHINEILLI